MNAKKAKHVRRLLRGIFPESSFEPKHSNVRTRVLTKPTGRLNSDGTQEELPLFSYRTSTVTIPARQFYRKAKAMARAGDAYVV